MGPKSIHDSIGLGREPTESQGNVPGIRFHCLNSKIQNQVPVRSSSPSPDTWIGPLVFMGRTALLG